MYFHVFTNWLLVCLWIFGNHQPQPGIQGSESHAQWQRQGIQAAPLTLHQLPQRLVELQQLFQHFSWHLRTSAALHCHQMFAIGVRDNNGDS